MKDWGKDQGQIQFIFFFKCLKGLDRPGRVKAERGLVRCCGW
ncbi:MAG: hypothetical protein ACI81V_001469 [Lentimonas sp.]|jgi:hypothetical protein